MHASDVPPTPEIEGDPATVDSGATAYGDMAELIVELAQQLRGEFDVEYAVGRAADQFTEDAAWVADEIDAVAPRYDGTSDALAAYAIDFEDAKGRAKVAIDDIDTTQTQLWPLYSDLVDAQNAVANARARGEEGEAELQAAEETLETILATIEQLEGDLDTLYADYVKAIEDHGDAANAAADRIEPILGELDDGFWAQVADFFRSLGDFLLDAFEQALMWVSDIIVIVLAALSVLTVMVLGMLVLPWDQIDFGNLFDSGAALAMSILGAAHWALVPVLHIENSRPTPRMVLSDVLRGLSSADRPQNYHDAFSHAGDVDARGGSSSTRVEIVRVEDGAGNLIGWRVIPPSTQDWELLHDADAANDLGSNLSLMLTPGEQAAYERMVIDAMEQAGIGPDDPVMMVGFSQSGILAGRMAESSDFNVEAIVVAGAPVDAMDIPPDVDVISIQHTGDPVHRLDGEGPADPSGQHVTIDVNPYGDPAADDAFAPGLQGDPGGFDTGRHNAHLYGDTIQAILNGEHPEVTPEQQEAIERIIAGQEGFFSDDEITYAFEGSE